MKELEAEASVVVRLKFKVATTVNENYRDDVDALEEEAMAEILSYLPKDVDIEVISASMSGIQSKNAEPEI